MCYSLGELDIADKVGVGNIFTIVGGLFGDKKYFVGAFNAFGGETGFTSTLCQAKTFVGSGNFPSRFLGAGTEILEREFGASIGVDHCGSGGNVGARLLVASVSGMILMWS